MSKVTKKPTNKKATFTKLAKKTLQAIVTVAAATVLLGLAAKGAAEYIKMNEDQATIVAVVLVALLAYAVVNGIKKLSK